MAEFYTKHLADLSRNGYKPRVVNGQIVLKNTPQDGYVPVAEKTPLEKIAVKVGEVDTLAKAIDVRTKTLEAKGK